MAVNHHSLAARLKRLATWVRKQDDVLESVSIFVSINADDWVASNTHDANIQDVRSELKSVMTELRNIADTLKPRTPRRSAGRKPG